MIRRTLAGLLCILLALGLGASGEVWLRSAAGALLSAADVPPDAPAETLFAAAQTACGLWEEYAPLLGAIVKHSDADTLGKLFAQLLTWASCGDAEKTAAFLSACRAELETLLEGERFRWKNVLNIR